MYKYLAVIHYIQSQIEAAALQEGAKLPSIRTLATQFECNKSTIIKALQELEKKHFIYSVPKSGYYVVKKSFSDNYAPTATIDFATSAPNWTQFPYVDFQHCINKAIDTYQQDLFIYGTPKGLLSLIDVVQKQLTSYQVFAKKEQIFITSGVQQALFILTMLPFPNKRQKIVVEQPSYHLFMEHLQTQQLPVLSIKRTAHGIDLEELEQLFSSHEVKFFYTMPRFHNPLGTSYSEKEKKAIAKLAEKYDVYIIEDDFLADFEQNTKTDPIFSYDETGHVIYLKSYSKIMFPGLRIGVAVIPETLMERFQQYKKSMDIDSSMISQAALEIYIKSGMFERNQKKVQQSYIMRASQLYQSLETHIQADSIVKPIVRPSSISVNAHLVLPKQININQVIQRLAKQQVYIQSIDADYLADVKQENLLKLNVSNVEENKIDEGIQLIVREINNRRNWFL